VVGGFRYGTSSQVVGSLLLGLYDSDGLLNHVGFTSGIAAADRPALTKRLEKLIQPPGFTGSAPGGPSRWNRGKENVWQPLQPKLVVEVCYDHVTGQRFRHGTKLLRWRPDKAPGQCKMEQLDQKQSGLLRLLK
jgi:ATP-dependent DNA ligase